MCGILGVINNRYDTDHLISSLDSIKRFPSEMLTDFILIVYDSLMSAFSFWSRDIFSKVLQWIDHVFKTRQSLINTKWESMKYIQSSQEVMNVRIVPVICISLLQLFSHGFS